MPGPCRSWRSLRPPARVSCGRVAFFPDGSPIIPVKSPIDEDDAVPEVLEVAHLAEDDRVPEVDVGSGRIESDLDRDGPARDLAGEVLLVDEIDGAPAQELELGFRRKSRRAWIIWSAARKSLRTPEAGSV